MPGTEDRRNLCKALILPSVLLIIALYNLPEELESPASHVINLHLAHGQRTPYYKAVAIGFNTCVDLIVRAAEVMNKLAQNKAKDQATLLNRISTLDAFTETFSYGFTHGSAIERFIENDNLCKQVIKAAQTVNKKVYHIGGNAALMGIRFAAEGANVLLGGAIGPEAAKLISEARVSEKMSFASNDEGKDEIHLIMEYSAKENWGGVESPRANRFIIHCDHTSSRLDTLEHFISGQAGFKPDVIVIAGLHMLEKEPLDFRTKRLNEVVEFIDSTRFTVPVHLELASVSNDEFLREILSTVGANVNSIGLNEQELAHVYHVFDKENPTEKDFTEFKRPRVDLVVEALTHTFDELHKQNKLSTRKLGRIHFHSLEYHLIAVKDDQGWDSGLESVVAGSLDASLKSCSIPPKDKLALDDVFDRFTLPFLEHHLWTTLPSNGVAQTQDQSSSVKQWKSPQQGLTFSLAIVGVCKEPKKTVGLGDSISAAGLLFHSFGSKK